MIGVAQKTVLLDLAAGLRFGFGPVALHASFLLDRAEVTHELDGVMPFERRRVIRVRGHDMAFHAGLARAAPKIHVNSVRKMRVGVRNGLTGFPFHGQRARPFSAPGGAHRVAFCASAGGAPRSSQKILARGLKTRLFSGLLRLGDRRGGKIDPVLNDRIRVAGGVILQFERVPLPPPQTPPDL